MAVSSGMPLLAASARAEGDGFAGSTGEARCARVASGSSLSNRIGTNLFLMCHSAYTKIGLIPGRPVLICRKVCSIRDRLMYASTASSGPMQSASRLMRTTQSPSSSASRSIRSSAARSNFAALAPALVAEPGIEADHQPLSGEVWAGDLETQLPANFTSALTSWCHWTPAAAENGGRLL